MEMLTQIIIGSMIVEAIIEYVGQVGDKAMHMKCISSLLFGSAFAFAYGLDLMAAFGLTTNIPFVGMIFTGILLSRGSNYIADFIKRLSTGRGGGND